jgi:hypothetical protein
MKRFIQLLLIVLTSLTLIQCSSDDNGSNEMLLVNGTEFKLGNSASWNVIKFENDGYISLNLLEKTDSAQRSLGIAANYHDANSVNGTYALRSDMSTPGVANIALYAVENETQLAGGAEVQPTGTIAVTDLGNNKYKIEFNNVVLDPGSASETTISGSLTKTFSL